MANLTIHNITDDAFGPFFKAPGRTTFDFTLLFEDTILSILPSSLLLLAFPVRVAQLWNETRKVNVSYIQTPKLTTLTIFALLQVANLVIWALDTGIESRASLAAAIVSLVAALALFALSCLEHSRSIRPSSIINAYLLFSVPFDAAKVRTLWLRGESTILAGIVSAVLAVKLLVLITEAAEKRHSLLSSYHGISPEETSGLYSRSLFWWLNPLFLIGYKGVLQDIDLFPTDEKLTSESLRRRFQTRWAHRPLLVAIPPRLFQSFFRFMNPLLIRRVTGFVNQPDTQSTRNQGWCLVGAYGLVYTGIAVSAAMHHHRANRMATMVRGTLITSIYTKTMDLSITALDESAAVTLMSADVQRITDALALFHELWSCPIEIGVALYMLAVELGLALLGPIVVIILAVTGTLVVTSKIAAKQKLWLSGIQTRVDVTAKVLQQMKGVKMLGLSSTLGELIQRLRADEIVTSIKARWLMGCSLVCGNSTLILAPSAAFAAFVVIANYSGRTLDVGRAFTTLSLLGLLADPVGVMIFVAPQFMTAVGCFERIQKYLLSTARQDHRLLMPTPGTSSRPDLRNSETVHKDTSSEGVELSELLPAVSTGRLPTTNMPTFRIIDCTLAWKHESRAVINDLSLDVYPGLTMLVGPVASGKSSLLKGLLGELPSSKGYIYTNSTQAAFVGQVPWIQHGTLRENILGNATLDQKLYAMVVHVCALDQDFQNLPDGDDTPVGSAGVGLSGGQKLRVALARAVYSRCPILILDDVFSGLDAKSEDRIFTRLLGRQGLLRNSGITIILATHAAHRLSHADKIVALSSTGTIYEQGTFPELMRAGSYVAGLTARHTEEAAPNSVQEVQLAKNAGLTDSARANAVDDLSRLVGDLKIYKYYFASIGYGNAVLFIGILGLWAFLLRFPDILVKLWTSAVAARGNSVNGRYLVALLVLAMLCLITLTWTIYHLYVVMIPRSAVRLHERLLVTVKNAPLSFFTSTDVGQIINRFSQDMNLIDFDLPMSFLQFTASSWILLIQAILICLSAVQFAAIMPALLVLMYYLQKFYLRTSRQIRLMDLEAKAPLFSNFIESLSGLTTIRAFGWASSFKESNIALLDKSQRPFYMLFCIQRWLQLVLDLTVAALAVLLMVLIVVLRTSLDPGLVGIALLNIMQFNIQLSQVISHWTLLETSLGAISRVKTFVQTTASEHLPRESEPVPDSWPSRGEISFTDVSASYTSDGHSALKDVTLSIPAGQRLALVGRSGSGKSSFVSTLFHMLEIQAGTVAIDGIDISTIPREELRRRINVVPQEPLFLAGTIRENIDPFGFFDKPDRNDATLLAALDKVGLASVVSSAGGLDVKMDPDALLSHGQRQLFCLARALILDRTSPSGTGSPGSAAPNQHGTASRVLLLDEPTAHVDVTTDSTMQLIIRDEFKEHTIIAVAHRLGTIRDFDRVVVLDHGKVVEDGAPDGLLEIEGGWFKTLWES